MKRGAIAIGLVILVLVATGAAGADQVNTVYLPVIRGPWPPLAPAAVTKVVDGDTIWVDLDGDATGDIKVRYLAIDTPEMNSNDCYKYEARHRNRQLVDNQPVALERDRRDSDDGRLLRHVYLLDATWINATLVAEGYALAHPHPPDTDRAQRLGLRETDAHRHRLGGWSQCNWSRLYIPIAIASATQ